MANACKEKLNPFWEVLRRFCLTHANSQLGGLLSADPHIFDLRDSVIYRARAITYHADLLAKQYAVLREHAAEDIARAIKILYEPFFVRDASQFITFLFDDLVFNVVSFFDYLGMLLGYVFAGERGPILDWKHLVKRASKRVDRGRLPETVAKRVIDADDEWLQDFVRFRSELIHQQARLVPAKHSLNLNPPVEASFEVFVPSGLTHCLRAMLPAAEKVDILVGAEAICSHALKTAQAIIDAADEAIKAAPPAWNAKQPPKR